MPEFTGGPYRKRTWLRSNLPWFLINLGVAKKGKDCEKKDGSHEWYKIDNQSSGCYHCEVVKTDKLWLQETKDILSL